MAVADKMVSKEFTVVQVEMLLSGCTMAVKSLERRINAETDADARAVWQRKADAYAVLLSKLRQ